MSRPYPYQNPPHIPSPTASFRLRRVGKGGSPAISMRSLSKPSITMLTASLKSMVSMVSLRDESAAREWIGLLVYWITGRTSELFPAP